MKLVSKSFPLKGTILLKHNKKYLFEHLLTTNYCTYGTRAA